MEIAPFEVWNARKPNVSNLRIFGSECFVHIPKRKRKKHDVKSEKAIFVGYAPNGYRVWNGKKVFVARDIVFNECINRDVSSDNMKIEKDKQVVLYERVQPSELVQAVNCNNDVLSEHNDDVEATSDEDLDSTLVDETAESICEETGVRRSVRNRVPPDWHKDYNISAFALSAEKYVDSIPSDIDELKKRDDWSLWEKAIEAELESLKKYQTWTLTELSAGRRPVGNKWVFTIKHDGEKKLTGAKLDLLRRGLSR